MAFTGGRPTPMPGTVPPVTAEYQEPAKSNKGLIYGVVGGLALVAAGIGAFLAFGNKEDPVVATQEQAEEDPAAVGGPPADETKVEPEQTPVVAEPEKVKEIAAGTETVNYKITTKDPDGNLVAAKILDPLDDAIYGVTNTDDGVQVAKSDAVLKLVITAEGFEPKEIEIFPVRDKFFEYTLDPEKKKTIPSKPPQKKANDSKKPDDKKPEDTKTDEKEDKPRRVSPDLKDPFGAKGK
jgi:serine/threonine-protein kinase